MRPGSFYSMKNPMSEKSESFYSFKHKKKENGKTLEKESND